LFFHCRPSPRALDLLCLWLCLPLQATMPMPIYHPSNLMAAATLLAATFAVTFAKCWPHINTTLRAVTKGLFAHPNDASMYSTRNAILHFHVQFGEHEGLIHACITDVALGGCIHNVAHLKAFHSLVLWHASPAITL